MSKLMGRLPKQTNEYALSNAKYLKYINMSQKDLLKQNNFNRYTTERISELKNSIEEAIRFDENGKVIGIPGTELAIMLFNNVPNRPAYEGLVLAYFGLVATSPNNNNIFYVPVECLDYAAYVVLPSLWHSFGATSESTSAIIAEDLEAVEREASALSNSSNSSILSNIKESIKRITSELQGILSALSNS